MAGILALPEVTNSRGAPFITIDGNNDLDIYSNDGTTSSVLIEKAISQDFSLEVKFQPFQLPDTLERLDEYAVFMGVYNVQDNAGGILISRSGIALLATYTNTAQVIPGSQTLFAQGSDYYTMRIVVEGSKDLMHIYVTKTDDLPDTGHILRYTAGAPVSPDNLADSVLIQVNGQPGSPTRVKLDTIRLDCSSAIIPNKRPIADAGADQTSTAGEAVTFDGRGSVDPEGAALLYDWGLVDAPTGSRYKLPGISGSTAGLPGSGFTTLFTCGGTNPLSLTNAPLLQPGDHLVVDDVVYKIAAPADPAVPNPATDYWIWNSTTQVYDRYILGLWPATDDVLEVTTATIPNGMSGEAWVVYHSDTFFNVRDLPNPYGITDSAGIYQAQLIVNDGDLDSLPQTALLNAANTALYLGSIPDVSWIWDHLPDFWNLVDDRKKIETVWSGFSQACASLLMNGWQVDYNKSLADIQRTLHRRWLGYGTIEYAEPEDAVTKIIRGPIFSDDLSGGFSVTAGVDDLLELVVDGGTVDTVTLNAGSYTTLSHMQTLAAHINTTMGVAGTGFTMASVVVDGTDWYLVFRYPYLLQIRPTGTANTHFGFSAVDYSVNDLGGDKGGISVAGSTLAFVTQDVGVGKPEVLDFEDEGVVEDDILIFGGAGYRVERVATDRTLTMKDDLPDSVGPDRAPWLISSSVTLEDFDFGELGIIAGDIAMFDVTASTETEPTTVVCEVLGAAGDTLGFNPKALLAHLDGVPVNYAVEFVGVQRTSQIPVDDTVLHIPRLQRVIKDPTSYLEEHRDYVIEGDDGARMIAFESGTYSITDPPPETLWAEVTFLDNRQAISDNFGSRVNFDIDQFQEKDNSLDYLSAVRGLWWTYFSNKDLHKVRVGVQILLGLPFAEVAGTILEIDTGYSATQGRIVAEDKLDEAVVRTYYYPKVAGLAVVEATGLALAVGDDIAQFDPLSGGVEVEDWISDPDWWVPFLSINKFLEVNKYARWLIRADVDTFDLSNLLFALDFAHKIRPHYTAPLFVLLKQLDDTIDVTDDVTMEVAINVGDSMCPFNPWAFRYDETDGSGNYVHHYDETNLTYDALPLYVYDASAGWAFDDFADYDHYRLCPAIDLWAMIGWTASGSMYWAFDTLVAYDDGDVDGDGNSDDKYPLFGPQPSWPPFTPLVGVVPYDQIPVAGNYWRGKTL
jgi:hypothetical protein